MLASNCNNIILKNEKRDAVYDVFSFENPVVFTVIYVFAKGNLKERAAEY